MKRTGIIAFVCVFAALGAEKLHAQMIVELGVGTQAVMQATHAENIVKYALMIQQQVQQIEQAYNQFQNMLRMEKMAMDNLKSVGKVKDFNDAKNWYNRQLYLEQQSEKSFANMGVEIGGKKYRLKDISDIPEALKTQFVDYSFSSEMSEADRKKMWQDLGLTPSNYAYLKTWAEREKNIAKSVQTRLEIYNGENAKDAEKYDAMLKSYDDDGSADEDSRIKDKTLQMQQNALLIDQNKKLGNVQNELATANELAVLRMKQEETLVNPGQLSETYGSDPFDDRPPVDVEVSQE